MIICDNERPLIRTLFVPHWRWGGPYGTRAAFSDKQNSFRFCECDPGWVAADRGVMPTRLKLTLPALKHGVYSSLDVLSGENRAEFEKTHRQLIAEYSVSGPLEHHFISMLAGLLWREQNLSIFVVA